MEFVISHRDQLALLALAEELHFGRAAQRLGIAPPQLSLTIKRAESAAGFQIFTRRPTVRLTAAGAVLIDAAQRIRREMQAAISTGREVATGRRGRVRLGFTGASIFTGLASLLEEYKATHPQVSLQLAEGSTVETIRALKAGELDLAVSREPSLDAALRSTPVIPDQLVLAVWEGHPAARLGSIKLKSLGGEPFIFINRTTAPVHHDRLMHACLQAGLEPNVVQTVDSWSATYALVRRRFGLAFGTEASAKLGFPGVAFLCISDPMPSFDFWLSQNLFEANPPVLKLIQLLQPREVGMMNSLGGND